MKNGFHDVCLILFIVIVLTGGAFFIYYITEGYKTNEPTKSSNTTRQPILKPLNDIVLPARNK